MKKKATKLKKDVNKESKIRLEGVITNIGRGGIFSVEIKGKTLTGKVSGKMRIHKIGLSVGSRVICDISPYDLTKCIITYAVR